MKVLGEKRFSRGHDNKQVADQEWRRIYVVFFFFFKFFVQLLFFFCTNGEVCVYDEKPIENVGNSFCSTQPQKNLNNYFFFFFFDP